MRQFIAFVKKEFYHIFRDRRTMLILLGMPVVQIILFGFAISTEVKNVRLAVLDPSNDVVTRKIIDRLDASEYFTVTARFHSPQEMEAAFLKNKVDMAIVFSERFVDDLDGNRFYSRAGNDSPKYVGCPFNVGYKTVV